MKYGDLNKLLKTTDAFKELGSNSAQMVTQILCSTWKSFLIAVKDYTKNPSKYLGKPKIPGYKNKEGRFTCTLTNCQTRIINGYLHFGLKRLHPYNKLIKTKVTGHHLSTRIVPSGGCYILEIIYEKEIQQLDLNKNNIAAIDLGVNNFVTMVNNIGVKPIVINGRGIKSYNQYWNKKVSDCKSTLKKTNGLDWSRRLQTLTDKRNFKMEYFMHCASKYVVNYCIASNIGMVVIGKNRDWKQNCKMNKTNNQNFYQIPYNKFIDKLKYKCNIIGIKVLEVDESYTSGTSFMDNEQPVKVNYNKKRRTFRGLFISNTGIKINADINAGYQIMKKAFPHAFAKGIEGVHLHPMIINI